MNNDYILGTENPRFSFQDVLFNIYKFINTAVSQKYIRWNEKKFIDYVLKSSLCLVMFKYNVHCLKEINLLRILHCKLHKNARILQNVSIDNLCMDQKCRFYFNKGTLHNKKKTGFFFLTSISIFFTDMYF